jgi:hypothetical protein
VPLKRIGLESALHRRPCVCGGEVLQAKPFHFSTWDEFARLSDSASCCTHCNQFADRLHSTSCAFEASLPCPETRFQASSTHRVAHRRKRWNSMRRKTPDACNTFGGAARIANTTQGNCSYCCAFARVHVSGRRCGTHPTHNLCSQYGGTDAYRRKSRSRGRPNRHAHHAKRSG